MQIDRSIRSKISRMSTNDEELVNLQPKLGETVRSMRKAWSTVQIKRLISETLRIDRGRWIVDGRSRLGHMWGIIKRTKNAGLRIVIGRLRCGPRGCISAVINPLKTHVCWSWSVDHAHAINARDRRVISIWHLRFCHVNKIWAVIINLNPTCSDRDRWSASTWSTPTARSIVRSDAPPHATSPER